MSRLVWLITGCSSGFGEEFVRQILSRGEQVVAAGRKLETLKHLERPGAAILELDVTQEQNIIDDIVAAAVLVYGRLDVVVNNAGRLISGAWEDLETDDFFETFNTNVFGPIKVTRAVLPYFRQARSGTLVFIGSLSGWVGHGYVGAYAGSKFALEGAVESLSKEIAPFGIRTLLMEPGRFRTKLLSQNNAKFRTTVLDDYKEPAESSLASLQRQDFTQPGDPRKFVAIVLDLVKGEGCAEGKNIPFRLPVGADAVSEIRAKLKDTESLLDEWDPIISDVNYSDI